MEVTDLLGAPVEPADRPAEIRDPVVDRRLPGGRTRVTAVRDRAVVHVDGIGTFKVADAVERVADGVT